MILVVIVLCYKTQMIYYDTQIVFKHSSRLTQSTQQPIKALALATYQGTSVIRAFRFEPRFR